MAGCRQLTDEEISIVIDRLEKPRDKALFVLGYTTGFRITELLSLNISDVFDGKKIRSYVKVQRKNTKGKIRSHQTLINEKAKLYLEKLIVTSYTLQEPLFKSREGGRITRFMAHKILQKGFMWLHSDLPGTLATHSMRKTFAEKVFKSTDIIQTKFALNHSSISTTDKYLPKDNRAIEEAIKNIK